MKKINLIFYALFPFLVFFNLFEIPEYGASARYVIKPMIMVWMAGYFYLNLADKRARLVKPVLLAFFFSWLGDVLLLFSGNFFFLSGLVNFLISHLFYISVFSTTADGTKLPLLRRNPAWTVPFVIFGISMLWVILPTVATMIKPALILYTIVILTMAATALNRQGRVPAVSFALVLAGAALFVVSDSMIALNKFSVKFAHAGFWVMLSYISAQLLIMTGLLYQANHNKE